MQNDEARPDDRLRLVIITILPHLSFPESITGPPIFPEKKFILYFTFWVMLTYVIIEQQQIIIVMQISNVKTKAFIKKYLSSSESARKEDFWGMVADAKGTDQRAVAASIHKMPYEEFLGTTYWSLVALRVKQRSKWTCSVCGKHKDLVVHHPDYHGHGFEMLHPDRLICVCQACHGRIHHRHVNRVA